MNSVALSVLDPSPIPAGATAQVALKNTLDLARAVEHLGYKRFWLAEHHNWKGMASSASPIIIGRVASATTSIRVGSAATLLSHYSPLSVAEQFGTLASYFPDRIDLGLGRAPGSDRLTGHFLNPRAGTQDYPGKVDQVRDLLYGPGLSNPEGRTSIHAIPGEGTRVPIWLHGSGTYSARLAGSLGLPFAFAAHFAPANMTHALQAYRDSFRPSPLLDQPYSLVAVSVIAGETTEEASRLATSLYLKYLMITAGTPGGLQPPIDPDTLWDGWSQSQRSSTEAQLNETIIGDADGIRNGIVDLVRRTSADEILIQSEIYDHQARLQSYGILARALPQPSTGRGAPSGAAAAVG